MSIVDGHAIWTLKEKILKKDYEPTGTLAKVLTQGERSAYVMGVDKVKRAIEVLLPDEPKTVKFCITGSWKTHPDHDPLPEDEEELVQWFHQRFQEDGLNFPDSRGLGILVTIDDDIVLDRQP